MSIRVSSYLCTVMVMLLAACGPSSGGGADAGLPVLPDRDGDNIADEHEGCVENRDSDNDGTPDCNDLDSDNDGINDIDEAGDEETYTKPRDADGDGTPDYIDLDSDNNGITDATEGANDLDSDGTGDFADLDNDGDTLLDTLEIGNDPSVQRDTDGDGVPDMWDLDSDDDTILDKHEVADDPDQDGLPSYRDLDSDDDCIADRVEAGDSSSGTLPPDSDGDGRYDFKDRDKDNDGLADSAEDPNCNGIVDSGETSGTSDDTDGDSVSDLIEVAAGTNPNNPADNPQANGDFVFVVPYQEPADPAADDLDFSTNLQTVDVYVLVDRSGSMSNELTSIRDNIQTVANEVTCPPLGNGNAADCIPDTWWGVGTVGYTGSGGDPYTNHLDVQPDPSRVSSSLITSEPPGGNAEPLSLATWSTCTGKGVADSGCTVSSPYSSRASCVGSPAGANGIGYPCFRPNALPVILLTTDEAPTQTYNCPTLAMVAASANNIGAKIVGVLGSAPATQTQPDLQFLASMTGAVDAKNGNVPLVVQGDNANAANAISTAIRTLATGVPLDIEAQTLDAPGDGVDAVSEFISRLETQQLGTAQCSSGLQEVDSNSDGYADRYIGVLPGTPVCWNLIAKQNNTVMPTDEPQLFQATVNVFGGVTLLDTRNVYFLVPPRPVDIPID